MVALAVAGCDHSLPPAATQPVAESALLTAASKKPLGRAPEIRTAGARERRASALALRLAEIDGAVRRWRRAPDLRVAHAAAEEARNLVVGPAGPYYGDADRDGAVAGASSIGLLPGLAGEAGLAQAADGRVRHSRYPRWRLGTAGAALVSPRSGDRRVEPVQKHVSEPTEPSSANRRLGDVDAFQQAIGDCTRLWRTRPAP